MLSLVVASLFLACTGSSEASPNDYFIYNGYNFGADRNSGYRSGVIDGYQTSFGEYTKNHGEFKHNIDYSSGWKHGRLKCKGK